MPLSSKGCKARVNRVIRKEENYIVAEITTYSCTEIGGQKKFTPDFSAQVLLLNKDKNLFLNNGDMIAITAFSVRNRDNYKQQYYPSYIIFDWEIALRNPHKNEKRKTKAQKEKELLEQRQAIEEEIEAEEQDLDEYIDNIDEDGVPF